MDSKILDEFQAAFGQELALVGDDLGALETAVQAKLRQLGQGLLQRLLARQPHGYQGSSIPCSCGGAKRFVAHRAKSIHTIFGWIEIGRAAKSAVCSMVRASLICENYGLCRDPRRIAVSCTRRKHRQKLPPRRHRHDLIAPPVDRVPLVGNALHISNGPHRKAYVDRLARRFRRHGQV